MSGKERCYLCNGTTKWRGRECPCCEGTGLMALDEDYEPPEPDLMGCDHTEELVKARRMK